MLVDAKTPVGGISIPELSAPTADQNRNYAMSKAGNWFLAEEFAERVRGDGVVSVTLNPGDLKTKIWDAAPRVTRILTTLVLHEPKMGDCTALWAGLGAEVSVEDEGRYVVPCGRWHPQPRKDIGMALKAKGEGGLERLRRFGGGARNRRRGMPNYKVW